MQDLYTVAWTVNGSLARPKNLKHPAYWTDKKEAKKYAERCNNNRNCLLKLFCAHKWRVKTLVAATVNKFPEE